ncbi:hypothetical protein HAX54_011337 [Datura stramonium]|uniref:DUF2382 domain-containing protein n=1 Tax=Datura stramonium TaxID=4076 RepID=A0ABS8THT6_DATST|nr:hypothetical protein [Datura stramonium]
MLRERDQFGSERRDKEWAELNNAIEELKVQRLKLEKQRELLHADREEIVAQIEQLKKLEDVKIIPDRIVTTNKLHSEETTVYIDKIVTVHEVTEIDVKKVMEGSPETLSGEIGQKVVMVAWNRIKLGSRKGDPEELGLQGSSEIS